MRGYVLILALTSVLLTSGTVDLLRAAPTVDQCATKGDVLGLSRIVEIDSADGPVFGGTTNHRDALDFLADKEVVLTFDDGPLRHFTSRILKALEDECTKATFFMVGRMAIADPDMVKEVANRGHTVATHTWSHRNLGSSGSTKANDEFELGNSAVAKALGHGTAPFFRFPYLSANRTIETYVKKRGYSAHWVDIDSKDYQTRSGATVQKRVMTELARKGKGIILMHDIQPSTVQALPGLLHELRQNGYKIVHIVPKAEAETIASYDEQAGRLLAAKQVAAAGNALATRAATWPANSTDAEVDVPPAPSKRARSSRQPASSHSDDSSEILPWFDPPARAQQAPARSKKPSGRDEPWQPSLFGY